MLFLDVDGAELKALKDENGSGVDVDAPGPGAEPACVAEESNDGPETPVRFGQ